MDKMLTQTYTLKLPYINKTLKVRPFVVKEEKFLLIAANSKDSTEISSTVLEVVKNCIIEPDIKVEKLPFFLVDFLFIFMRAKSVSNTIDVEFRCFSKKDDGTSCNIVFPAEVDIQNVAFDQPKGEMSNKIYLDGEKTGCIMKFPTYTEVKSIDETLSELDQQLLLLSRSIDKIWEGDKVETPSEKDKLTWLENLNRGQYNKLLEWINNFPSFHVNIEKECPQCGFKHKIEFRDFNRFF